jgi:hypothetical protein
MMALVVLAWGIGYLAQALVLLGYAIENSTPFGTTTNAYWGVKLNGVLGFSLVLLAMALGWQAEALARWAASDDPAPVSGPDISSEALMPVACAGVGLFAITRALPTFFRFVSTIVFTPSALNEVLGDNEWKTSLGADALLLAWGLWLIFGNRGLFRIVKWARSGGKEPLPSNSGNPSPPDSSQSEEP